MEGFQNVSRTRRYFCRSVLITHYHRHDGLTRGISHLQTCQNGEVDCKNKHPRQIRYNGLRHSQEDPSHILSCLGPRGLPLNESEGDAVWAHPGRAVGKEWH